MDQIIEYSQNYCPHPKIAQNQEDPSRLMKVYPPIHRKGLIGYLLSMLLVVITVFFGPILFPLGGLIVLVVWFSVIVISMIMARFWFHLPSSRYSSRKKWGSQCIAGVYGGLGARILMAHSVIFQAMTIFFGHPYEFNIWSILYWAAPWVIIAIIPYFCYLMVYSSRIERWITTHSPKPNGRK